MKNVEEIRIKYGWYGDLYKTLIDKVLEHDAREKQWRELVLFYIGPRGLDELKVVCMCPPNGSESICWWCRARGMFLRRLISEVTKMEDLTQEERMEYDAIVAAILAEEPDNGDPEGQAKRAGERALAMIHVRRQQIEAKKEESG